MESTDTDEENYTPEIIILDIICITGFIFSVLWICMAKGSKYWYERHENGIQTLYDRQHDMFDEDLNLQLILDDMENFWNMGNYTYLPHHGTLPMADSSYKPTKLEGSNFSTSKINILIGYIFASVWSVLVLVQVFLVTDHFEEKSGLSLFVIIP